MDVATGQLLVARLWKWDAARLKHDADLDRRERLADGELDPPYTVSAWGMIREDGVEVEKLMRTLCEHVARHRRGKWVTFTTDAQLAASGFRLEESGPYEHHYDVVLGTQLTDDRIARLEAVFNQETRRRFPSCEVP